MCCHHGSSCNCGPSDADDVSCCDGGAPSVGGWPLCNCGVPDACSGSSSDGGAPGVGGRSSCTCGVPNVGGWSRGNCGVPNSAGGSLCNSGSPGAGDVSSCNGRVPDVGGRLLSIRGRGCNDSSEFARFSNATVTALVTFRDLWRIVAGAAAATWMTERISRIRVAALSRRMFVGLCDVDKMMLKAE